ncbi:hypothetical protein MKY14_21305 [Paenibacillus sp. FSL R5-0887]|uniref:hypothetical protein n=1 Tax=Paenibacillus sp. FSL R5-0887 TaxID=2921662 RepID=UPI0030F8E391
MSDLFINSMTSVVSALVGALFGYRGAIKGSILQIQQSQQKEKEEREERQKNMVRSIFHLLSFEIEQNFSHLSFTSLMKILESEGRVDYLLNTKGKMKFEEYNSIKYEMMKQMDDEYVMRTITTYHFFYTLNKCDNILNLTESEYALIKYKWTEIFKDICEYRGININDDRHLFEVLMNDRGNV